ncbi:MAG TPA: glycosyltransferase, exosortase A system-associated [Gammaproteobacteria bacterium]|nr:glycosyltransferase, exosortase A system-associated [Gammaproteobacteria bacterium]
MRILHVLDHSLPLHSGYTFRSRAILKAQQAMGLVPVALTGPKQGPAASALETIDGIDFHRTPLPKRWLEQGLFEPWGVVSALRRRILELAPRLRPDLIHAHSPALDGMAAVLAGRRLGLPVVYEVRAFWEDAAVDHGTSRAWGPRYRLTRALETWVLRRADAVTAICQGLLDDIAARGIPASRLTQIPNAVDPEAFAAGAERDPLLAQRLGLPPAGPVIGFIGSFYAYEGLDLLIEGFTRLAREHPTAALLLVGGGPEEAALKAQAARAPVAARIHFAGRVPHAEVPQYYALIDLLAYPRHRMRLTELVTPLKPLEAMAMRRPFCASDVGGHRELIRDGETGYLFPADDAAALAERLAAVLDARGDWERVLDAGERYVREERNWTNSVSRYREVYAAAQANARRRQP